MLMNIEPLDFNAKLETIDELMNIDLSESTVNYLAAQKISTLHKQEEFNILQEEKRQAQVALNTAREAERLTQVKEEKRKAEEARKKAEIEARRVQNALDRAVDRLDISGMRLF